MGAKYVIGDSLTVLRAMPDRSVDFIMTSPPFLALRSYLPADHPDKAFEIGSEATPAEFIDVLLELTAEWRRVLAPHGSIAVELGDTYAGSDNTGNVHEDAKWSNRSQYRAKVNNKGPGWSLPKSLSLIPEAYRFALAYGINPHTGQPSPAGRWRLRNVVRWCRPNPPVGALGDKWRPATSDIAIACMSDKRYWDGDATRVEPTKRPQRFLSPDSYRRDGRAPGSDGRPPELEPTQRANPAGAPLLDWWKGNDDGSNRVIEYLLRTIDEMHAGDDRYTNATSDIAIACMSDRRYWDGDATRTAVTDDEWRKAGQKSGESYAPWSSLDSNGYRNERTRQPNPAGAPLLDYWVIVPKGYEGAHYAVYPPELCVAPIEAMCPRRVCLTCGAPSRRIQEHGELEATPEARIKAWDRGKNHGNDAATGGMAAGLKAGGFIPNHVRPVTETTWSTCGCPGTDGLQLDGYHTGTGWRPGVVLDPFAGTFTTGAVATGHGRDAIGIDLDPRNADLALERVGPLLLTVEHHQREDVA